MGGRGGGHLYNSAIWSWYKLKFKGMQPPEAVGFLQFSRLKIDAENMKILNQRCQSILQPFPKISENIIFSRWGHGPAPPLESIMAIMAIMAMSILHSNSMYKNHRGV